jgi:hypothetical protein
MATPNPLYFACFPLQEYFVNKDTGFPLAGGYVEFFSDPAFTVPKDVYQQSLINNNYTYTNLGSVLVLSSVGTFQDNNGNDIIPFLYPYNAEGEIELYFVRVWSGDPSAQGSVLQFTRQGWPPNFIQSTSPSDVFESSLNLFTNPQFSIVNFNNTSGQTYYEITVGGAGNFEFAPGWSIYYDGAGSLKISQQLLSVDWPTNPSYYLEVISDAAVLPITLRQRLDQSPRVFEDNYLSVAMLAACANNIAEVLTIDYVINGNTSKQVLSQAVPNNSTFGLLAGVGGAPVLIDITNNTAPDTGYVEMQVSVPSGRTMRYTSLFGCTVQNATSLVSGSQSTNAQQTNAMFWYYKPQLAYKPIPSYTLGWDFAMNPFQAQGTAGVTYNVTGPGKSTYIADQTILFQSAVNNTTVSKVDNRALKLAVAGTATSLALVQYLGANEAQELLNSPVCSEIRAKISTGTLKGQIHLYYTVDATLPVLGTNLAANSYSLVTAVDNTSGAPSVGGGSSGTWIEVTRDTLGAANFTLSSTKANYGFAGWDESAVAGINNATYFAIVVSFAQVPVGSSVEVEHISLQKGYIPTAPAAMSFGETLAALQQYYEKSYNYNVAKQTATNIGAVVFGQSTNSLQDQIGTTAFYKTMKRAAPTASTPPAATDNLKVYSTVAPFTEGQIYDASTAGNRIVSSVISGQSSFWITFGAQAGGLGNTLIYQWVADARYGIQN